MFFLPLKIGGLTVKNQPLGLEYSGLLPSSYDGIMGFSYPAYGHVDNFTMIDRLVEQGQIDKRVACVKLRAKEKAESEFILGGCDVQAEGYAPVMKIGGKYTGWRLNLTKVILRSTEDNSELLTLTPNHETVLDTGAGVNLGNDILRGILDFVMFKHFFVLFYVESKPYQQST